MKVIREYPLWQGYGASQAIFMDPVGHVLTCVTRDGDPMLVVLEDPSASPKNRYFKICTSSSQLTDDQASGLIYITWFYMAGVICLLFEDTHT